MLNLILLINFKIDSYIYNITRMDSMILNEFKALGSYF